jgi:hypothetical protein
MEADHLCGNPGCLNGRHIEAVTHEEHVRRTRERRRQGERCNETP